MGSHCCLQSKGKCDKANHGYLQVMDVVQKGFGQSEERGALSLLYCATEPALAGGLATVVWVCCAITAWFISLMCTTTS